VLGELSAGTISWSFPLFEAELVFLKYDVIYLIFLGGGGIMSKIIIFHCTVKDCKLTNL